MKRVQEEALHIKTRADKDVAISKKYGHAKLAKSLLIVSDNLDWNKFSKINNHLYDLNGVKPVVSISRNYPHKEKFTHVIGYVSQANEDDIDKNESIKKNFI